MLVCVSHSITNKLCWHLHFPASAPFSDSSLSLSLSLLSSFSLLFWKAVPAFPGVMEHLCPPLGPQHQGHAGLQWSIFRPQCQENLPNNVASPPEWNSSASCWNNTKSSTSLLGWCDVITVVGKISCLGIGEKIYIQTHISHRSNRISFR